MIMAEGIWDSYNSRLNAKGTTKRGVKHKRLSRYIDRKLPHNLSYHTAFVNGVERELAIINREHYDLKTVISLPGEDIDGGSMIEWLDEFWVVVSKDANNEVYTKVVMQQCNYLLKWIEVIDGEPVVMEQWCYVSDGTKYLTGETPNSYNETRTSLGDSRVQMVIAKNEYTSQFSRSSRFIIDDVDFNTKEVLAYRLTKPFKLTGVFTGQGVYGFVLAEVNTEETDYVSRCYA